MADAVVYTLRAIVCHRGHAEAGHYVCYRVCEAGLWRCYDDGHVSPAMTAASVLFDSAIMRDIYCLLYARTQGPAPNGAMASVVALLSEARAAQLVVQRAAAFGNTISIGRQLWDLPPCGPASARTVPVWSSCTAVVELTAHLRRCSELRALLADIDDHGQLEPMDCSDGSVGDGSAHHDSDGDDDGGDDNDVVAARVVDSGVSDAGAGGRVHVEAQRSVATSSTDGPHRSQRATFRGDENDLFGAVVSRAGVSIAAQRRVGKRLGGAILKAVQRQATIKDLAPERVLEMIAPYGPDGLRQHLHVADNSAQSPQAALGNAAVTECALQLLRAPVARLDDIINRGGGARALVIHLLRAGFTFDRLRLMAPGAISKRRFTAGGALGDALVTGAGSDAALQAIDALPGASRRRNIFSAGGSYSSSSSVKHLNQQVEAFAFVLDHASFGWAHRTVDLINGRGCASHPFAALMRGALDASVVAKLVVSESPARLYAIYQERSMVHGHVCRKLFFYWLSAPLFHWSKSKGGVCNLHCDCARDFNSLEALARATIGHAEELHHTLLALNVSRRHVFGSTLAHAASRTSLCASHNCAFVLGEPGDADALFVTCAQCMALVEALQRILQHAGERCKEATHLACMIAFCFGHTVIDADNIDYSKTIADSWRRAVPGRAVLEFDYMMKLKNHLAPHVSKRDWCVCATRRMHVVMTSYELPPRRYGDKGCIFGSSVLFVNGAQDNATLHATNDGYNKQDWLASLAMFEAHVRLLKRAYPELQELMVRCDRGPNLLCNDFVTALPFVLRAAGVRLSYLLVAEAGHGKGFIDMQLSVIKRAIVERADAGVDMSGTTLLLRGLAEHLPRGHSIGRITYDLATAAAAQSIPNISHACLFEFIYDAADGAPLASVRMKRTGNATLSWTVDASGWRNITTAGAQLVDGVGPLFDHSDRRTSAHLSTQLRDATTRAGRAVLEERNGGATVRLLSSTCPLCPVSQATPFLSLAQATEHVRGHFDASRSCSGLGLHGNTCIRPFIQSGWFVRHVLRKHVGLVFVCARCGADFKHLELAQGCCHLCVLRESPLSTTCWYCFRVFRQPGSHVARHVLQCADAATVDVERTTRAHAQLRRLLARVAGFYECRVAAAGDDDALDELQRPVSRQTVEQVFPFGFGSAKRLDELKPAHRKTALEIFLLYLGWFLGADKGCALFPKKDATSMAELMRLVTGECTLDAGQIVGYWGSISKTCKSYPLTSAELATARVWYEHAVRTRDPVAAQRIPPSLWAADTMRHASKRTPLADTFVDNISEPFSPMEQVVIRSLWHLGGDLDANADGGDAPLAARDAVFVCDLLRRLRVPSIVRVLPVAVERFWRLYEPVSALQQWTRQDRDAVRTWLRDGYVRADANRELLHDEKRFPRPSFLSANARRALEADLECIRFTCICTKPDAFCQWIECEAGVDCVAFQWYHVECVGAGDALLWLCPLCEEARRDA